MSSDRSRRSILRSIGAGVTLTGVDTLSQFGDSQVARTAISQEEAITDHPVVGVDPGRSGHNPSAAGPKDGVNIAWSIGGAGTDTPEFAEPPTLINGTVYVRYGRSTIGYAARSGDRVWSSPEQESLEQTVIPTVSDGVLFQALSNYEEGGELTAIDLDSKQVEWQQSAPEVYDTVRDNSPVIVDETLYTSTENTVYAVDTASGEIQWQVDTPTYNGQFRYPVAVHGGSAYVTEVDGILYALGTDRGVTQWEISLTDFDFSDFFMSGPTVVDGVGCVSTDDGILVFDPADGTAFWKSSERITSPPAIADGLILVGVDDGGSDELTGLRAYDASRGVVSWEFATTGHVSAQPVVADGVVYFGTEANRLFAVDAASGEQLWQIGFRTPIYRQPIVTDQWVFVVTDAGELFALRDESAGPPPIGPHQSDPTDPDADGVYEDVDGDGDVDIADVQTLYDSRNSDAVQAHSSAFDFNGDGSISIGDIQALFDEYLRLR